MLTQNGKLEIFENFQIDRSLPKYQRHVRGKGIVSKEGYIASENDEMNEEDSGVEEKMSNADFNFRQASNVVWTNNVTSTISSGVGVTLVPFVPVQLKEPVKRPSWFSRLAFWRKPAPPPPALPASPPEPEPTLTIEDFFASVKNSAEELVVVRERAQGYEKALLNAKRAGQQALVEKLTAGINAYKMETQLIAMGLIKFISEENVVRFYKECKKGLRLDYVRNFTRIIPENLVAMKMHADEVGIFDNYAVLHYDPQAKAFSETEEEKARKRDPILFGLMKDRRVLYFVGDWVDDVCGLTLDQVAEIIGKRAIQSLTTEDHTLDQLATVLAPST